ncbi:NAT5 [Candida pseudojiufengensis]|uniref:NAT5 n=1 Tax=Candida pseudojiufengensis TaxID=497109 RepID=UPI00222401E7|nr:NAT5 [Candida pseudojiufengensis]KAI5962430.1 NAT5 [Candida pseudojiufengensis]
MGRNIIALDDPTINNIGVFKKINEVSLPTIYPESWYKSSLESNEYLVQLAYYAELPVGAIKAKTFSNNSIKSTYQESINSSILQKTPNCVYIESFAVLKKYRNLGIGSELLNWIIEETKKRFIHEILIHVHVNNEYALQWYKKKGFIQDENIVKDYYKEQGLENPDAYILKLKV